MGNETIKMLVTWTRNVQVSPANVIYGLVVHKECTIRVFDSAVGRKNSVVWLDNGG